MEKHIPQKRSLCFWKHLFQKKKKKKKIWYEEALFWGNIFSFISNLNIYVVLQNTWYGKINEKYLLLHIQREKEDEKFF